MVKTHFAAPVRSFKLLNSLTAWLLFVAPLFIAGWLVLKSENAAASTLACRQIYSVNSNHLSLANEIQQASSEYRKVVKKIKGLGPIEARMYQRDQLRERYSLILQGRLNQTRSLRDLSTLFEWIDTLNPHDEILMEAVRNLDFLSPFREHVEALRPSEARDFSQFLREKSTRTESTLIPWKPVFDAYSILLVPQKAIEVLQKLLLEKESLFDDWSYQGNRLDRSLMTSLEQLPTPVQNSALQMLRKAQIQFDKWYATQVSATESEEIQEKVPRRNMQALRRILLQENFKKNLRELQDLAPERVVTNQFLTHLEQTLLPFQIKKSSYTMKHVLAVAIRIHEVFQRNLSHDDYVEIFGSFPNLSANLKTSDIDLIFSDRLDSLYRKEINGGSLGSASFAAFSERSGWSAGKELAQLLVQAESEAQKSLGLRRGAGDLLSPTWQIVTNHKGAAIVEERREDLMRYFASIGPATILITQQDIIIRIYDSFQTAPGAKSEVLDFYVPLTGSAAKLLIGSPDR